MHKRLGIVLTITLCPVAGWTAGAWHASVSDRGPGRAATVDAGAQDPPASGLSALPMPLIEAPLDDNRRDLYGNDVSPAIARYRRDAAGAVREEHAPATEVARLASPTT